ncbi:conserved hypothetical protein [Aggregatibacter aphrophilus NJ8700]|nr:conserved hypothetical protein [Aggregatibacter aphrophilus NJ8700]
MRKALLIVLLLLSPLTFAFSEGELITLLQTPKNVQGDFTQQRFLKSLTKPITTQGKFTLLAQKGLLWQMEKPFANQLRVKKTALCNGTGNNGSPMGKWDKRNKFRCF